MPLPRVAHLSTGAAGPRGPISPSAERGAFGAAPESRALRYEKGGAMHSTPKWVEKKKKKHMPW